MAAPTRHPWRVNELVEALDEKDHKWYKAKIKQINDGFIRIHFMKWSDKYDAWYPSDSPCIRRAYPPSSQRNFNLSASSLQQGPSVSYADVRRPVNQATTSQSGALRRDQRPRTASANHHFQVNERVICKWRDSIEYVAHIIGLLDGGDYEVRYLDNVTQRVRASSVRAYSEAGARQLFERERRLQEESMSRNMMWYDPVASKIKSESRERRRLQSEVPRTSGLQTSNQRPNGPRGGHQSMHQRWDRGNGGSNGRDAVHTTFENVAQSDANRFSGVQRKERWSRNPYTSEVSDSNVTPHSRQPTNSTLHNHPGNHNISEGRLNFNSQPVGQLHHVQTPVSQRQQVNLTPSSSVANTPVPSYSVSHSQYVNRQPLRPDFPSDNRQRRYDGNRAPFRSQTTSQISPVNPYPRANQSNRQRNYNDQSAAIRTRSRRVTRSPRRFSDHVLLQTHRGNSNKRMLNSNSNSIQRQEDHLPPQNTSLMSSRGRRTKLVARTNAWKNQRSVFRGSTSTPASENQSTSTSISFQDAGGSTMSLVPSKMEQVSFDESSQASVSSTRRPIDGKPEHESWPDSSNERESNEIAYESSPGNPESVVSQGSPLTSLSSSKPSRNGMTFEKSISVLSTPASYDEPSPKRRKIDAKDIDLEDDKEEAGSSKSKAEVSEPNESSPYIVRCIVCRSNDESLSSIQCDVCQCWVHMECYNLDPESDPPPYFECIACKQPKRLRKSRLGSWRYAWLRQTCNSLHRLRQQSNQPTDLRILYRTPLKNLQRCFDLHTFLKKSQSIESRLREELETLSKEHAKLSESSSPYDGEAMLRVIERVRQIKQSQEEMKVILSAVKSKMSSYAKNTSILKQDKGNTNPLKEIRAFLLALNKQSRVLNMLQVFNSPDSCSCIW